MPKKISRKYKTTESIKSGSNDSIKLKIWEGEIESPTTDNRFIGNLKIDGLDLSEGMIPVGADIDCEININDSGNIFLSVDIPSIGERFESDKNFYSIQEGKIDLGNDEEYIEQEAQRLKRKIQELKRKINHKKLQDADLLLDTILWEEMNEGEIEKRQETMENLYKIKKLIAEVQKTNQSEILSMELQKYKSNSINIKSTASEIEKEQFDSLIKSAENALNVKSYKDCEYNIKQIKRLESQIWYRTDDYHIACFHYCENESSLFLDKDKYRKLIRKGNQYLNNNDIEKLKFVLSELFSIKIETSIEDQMLDHTNLMRV